MTPLVSVRLMVYNNEPFIKETMNGIMSQQTDFDFEVVVGDDFSTDQTLEIIKSYSNTEKIKIRILDRPVGGEYWIKRKESGTHITNFLNILNKCKGKYIALLDGDDYWADEQKLQKQVTILKNNTELIAIGSRARIRNSRDNFGNFEYGKQYYNYDRSHAINKKDFIDPRLIPFHTSTLLFKKSAIFQKSSITPRLAKTMEMSVSGDIVLYNYLNSKGQIFFLNEELGIQNLNSFSITNQKSHFGLFFLWNRFTTLRKVALFYKEDKELKTFCKKIATEFRKQFEKKINNRPINRRLSFVQEKIPNKFTLIILLLKGAFNNFLIKLKAKSKHITRVSDR